MTRALLLAMLLCGCTKRPEPLRVDMSPAQIVPGNAATLPPPDPKNYRIDNRQYVKDSVGNLVPKL